MSKAQTISNIYYDPAGYGSIRNTFKEAHDKDGTITIQDVKTFFTQKIEKTTKARGQNSYVAKKAFEEFQVDLFFINDLLQQFNKEALLMVDIFTKFMTVVVLPEGHSTPDLIVGMKEAFTKMGGTPEMIYTDQERSMGTPAFAAYLASVNVMHIPTRGHAPVAERSIRTFKDMLYKRIGNNKTKQWTELIFPILFTYNTKNIHSTIGMTPLDAKKASNQATVKARMEIKAKHGRKYEEVKVGDYVKIFKKKKTGQKQQHSYWSKESHEVMSIETTLGQTFYKVDATFPLLRHEILKVPAP